MGAPQTHTGSAHLQAVVQHLQHRAGCRATTWQEKQPAETPRSQHHVVLAPHPTASAGALEPSLSLHSSEAGPAAPPKGSFLSHLPWPRGVRSDSSPAPQVPPSNSPSRDLPHPRPAHHHHHPHCPGLTSLGPPPVFRCKHSDHVHCMRTPSAPGFLSGVSNAKPGKLPLNRCLLLLQDSPRLRGCNPPRRLRFCMSDVCPGLARPQPRRPPAQVFLEVGVWLAG